MYDIPSGKIEIAFDNLLHKGTNFVLCKFVFDEPIQISITQFSDDIGIVFGSIDLVHIEYVLLVFELLENGDFALE